MAARHVLARCEVMASSVTAACAAHSVTAAGAAHDLNMLAAHSWRVPTEISAAAANRTDTAHSRRTSASQQEPLRGYGPRECKTSYVSATACSPIDGARVMRIQVDNPLISRACAAIDVFCRASRPFARREAREENSEVSHARVRRSLAFDVLAKSQPFRCESRPTHRARCQSSTS